MNKATLERNFAALLFVLVLIAFSFADRDSKKLEQLYKQNSSASQFVKKDVPVAFSPATRTIQD
jgi:hypothetical protein